MSGQDGPTVPAFDPGSFKDPEGRIFFVGGRVFRTLSPSALERMQSLARSGVLKELIGLELLLPSWLIAAEEAGLDAQLYGQTVMEHSRIPVETYPYEWSFDMLREAALVTLDLFENCLDRGLTLKDATAYNVMPYQGRMTFIDTLSLDTYTEGEPWFGYAQFCREFLFPLMLTAYKGVNFHPWFRGELNGLQAGDVARLFSLRDFFRRGVIKHVFLQKHLEDKFAAQDMKIRDQFKKIKYSRDLIRANLRGLGKLIKSFEYKAGDSRWVSYTTEHSYTSEEEERKQDFVRAGLKRLSLKQVVDLGCNIGTHSLIAASTAERVISLDIDPACINVLFQATKRKGVTNIVPLVADLRNPSPALGWRLRERKPLLERIRSDGFLALALVHHICIGGNVPLEEFVESLAQIGKAGIVEWVDKKDAMVQQMLRNREDVFADYDWEHFAALLRAKFELVDISETHGGGRKLCLLGRCQDQ